jgi:hypothetical protein
VFFKKRETAVSLSSKGTFKLSIEVFFRKILGFLTCHTSGLFKSFRNGVKSRALIFSYLTKLHGIAGLVVIRTRQNAVTVSN